MGTRNLTMVVADGEMKVAQYGQWDGYPGGQGATVLKFLKTQLKKNTLSDFEKRVRELSYYVQEGADWEKFEKSLEGMSESEWKSAHPELTRDTAAEILQVILDKPDLMKMSNHEEFAADGLFCEWAYLIDLDKKVLECYRGFYKENAPEGQRFAKYNGTNKNPDGAISEYGPIQLVKTYPFDQLPGENAFIKDLEPPEDDEES